MKTKAFLAIFLSLIFIFPQARIAAADGLVIAHYLLYAQDSADVLKQEIQLAQSKGIDAFALNTNVWRKDRADAIFQAAQDLGSGFKLFFSADIHEDSNGKLSPDDIVAMLTYSSSSLLTYNGKQLFTSWLGDDDSYWQKYNYASSVAAWQDIFQKAGGKDKFFYVPFFPTDGSYDRVKARFDIFRNGIDGLHAWDVSAWPYTANDGFQSPDFSRDQNYLQACNDQSKSYMPSVSPWWFKRNDAQCVRGNYQGPGLWTDKWKKLIEFKTPFLQIVTWNDWVESHYVGPTTLSRGAADAGVDYVIGFPHVAFLELGEHYIKWYKTGNEPAVTEDSLYMFYYTQSKNLGAECSGSANLTDKLYVTAMVTESATLELTSGGTSQTFTITDKGISTWSIDFQQGQQAAVLKRGDAVVTTLTGSKQITNVYSNFNVYSTCTKCSIE
uniref:Uncharacterized protein n=1 Tax=Araucaria cunninghamii TaxID=56994 RepID=A0A0D6QSA5_ARACU